jgi:hypothetical protein
MPQQQLYKQAYLPTPSVVFSKAGPMLPRKRYAISFSSFLSSSEKNSNLPYDLFMRCYFLELFKKFCKLYKPSHNKLPEKML